MLDAAAGSERSRPRLLSYAAAALALFLCAAFGGEARPSAGKGTDSTVVGPRPVSTTLTHAGHVLAVGIRPNRAGAWNRVTLTLLHRGAPVRDARVKLSFDMPTMTMGTQTFPLAETQPGVYEYFGPVIVMLGRWKLIFRIAPSDGPHFTALVLDRVARASRRG
jgi:hypothetical protein